VKVQVVLEDTPKDEHIAVAVVRALFQSVGRIATVAPLRHRFRGVDRVTNPRILLPELAARCGMVDLFILIVDRDCTAPGRPRGGDRASDLRELEAAIRDSGRLGECQFLACEAIEELEVWLLAGFQRPGWQEIRDECDPKEAFFEPFAREMGVFDDPAEGRAELMAMAAPYYNKRIRVLCPELQELESRVRETIAGVL
jgi:hypothetical protein